MQGKIIKGIAGFYYVYVNGYGLFECKAKGVFRNKKQKPLVGDNVEISVISEEQMTGNMTEIFPRNNELLRPAVANVDQALLVFAMKDPKPNLNLLDRFLMMMLKQNVPTMICFNKSDIVNEADQQNLRDIYQNCGCELIFTSTYTQSGIETIQELIHGKTTALAGPSGVGKSSLLNCLDPDVKMETGLVSEKIRRGRHTTRHSELIHIEDDTYVMDTPGFSSLFTHMFEKEEIKDYFYEFRQYDDFCRFQGCMHMSEPDCAVKEALAEGKISQVRYDNYKLIYEEVRQRKKKW
ncbi:MAG: ribosome small subunit-dependent GTPase A [Lachnospiraceae bacterium]|nr:ribosome small subunit-dependent GTPase A [Lachnospiraceae bacterium]